MGSEKDKVREFTTKELAEFDGRNGKPVYVAFGGTVYDVSNSPLWKRGSHFRRHLPGTDLTDQMGCAPHGADVLGRPGIEAVGVLVKRHAEDPVPTLLAAVYRRFPFMRRHTHPASVHFPIAFLTAASAFTFLSLFLPGLFGIDHEKTAFMMLVLAALFTPVTIATGIVIWRVDYQFRSYRRIRYLIALSAVIMSLELVCLYLRIPGPVGEGGAALIYNGIMLLLGPLAGLAGYNGGQLVYPTNK
jgi:predicted heme/steroid binding protein